MRLDGVGDEQRPDVALVQIVRDPGGDDLGVAVEGRGEAVAQLRRYAVADVQQLTDVGVVGRAIRIVTQRRGKRRAVPPPDRLGRRQLVAVDLHHRGVRAAQLVDPPIRRLVDQPGDFQTVAAGLGQGDQFLQPRGAGCLEMHAGVELPQRLAHRSIEGELVAPGMDTQLQVARHLELAHGKRRHGQALLKLPLELRHVANVIYPLVKLTDKTRGDRLERNLFVGRGRKNHQQFHRRLWLGGFIHRHFDYRLATGDCPDFRFAGDCPDFRLGENGTVPLGPLGLLDTSIDAPRLADGRQKLPRRRGDHRPRHFQRTIQSRHRQRTDEPRVTSDKRLDGLLARVGADPVGHVEREEVAGGQKGVHGLQADVVGVDEIGPLPAAGPHRRVSLGPHVFRPAADDRVLAVRFVPDGRDLHAVIPGQQDRLELRQPLAAKTVAHADRVFWQHHDSGKREKPRCGRVWLVASRDRPFLVRREAV